MENTNTTSPIASSTIQELITKSVSTELLKRGFTARLSIERKTTRHGQEYIEITSEPFNTVPVIMSEIRIDGTLYVSKSENGEGRRVVNGRIGVRYQHFTGGSNGTELFAWSCVLRSDIGDSIFNAQAR
jgi:intein/homing endonuclease